MLKAEILLGTITNEREEEWFHAILKQKERFLSTKCLIAIICTPQFGLLGQKLGYVAEDIVWKHRMPVKLGKEKYIDVLLFSRGSMQPTTKLPSSMVTKDATILVRSLLECCTPGGFPNISVFGSSMSQLAVVAVGAKFPVCYLWEKLVMEKEEKNDVR